MSDFIREVDEEVRNDLFRRLFERYWIALAVAVILILAGVGAWRANDYFTAQKAQTAGGRYLDALDLSRDGKSAEAAAALQGVVKDGTPGYRLLARFRLAALTGQTDAAAGAKLFDAIAADGSIDPALQNLARLRAALLLVDQLPYPEIKKRLDPLADANSSLRNSARELLAIAALKAGQNEAAGQSLDAIETDPTAPPDLRQRAEAMLGLVRSAGEKASAPAASAPATPPVSPTDVPPSGQPANGAVAPAETPPSGQPANGAVAPTGTPPSGQPANGAVAPTGTPPK